MRIFHAWKLVVAAAFFAALPQASAESPSADLASYVDMAFPDGGKGAVFRGADVPFGMMMWGPGDQGYGLTFLSGADMDGGYQRNLPIQPSIGMPGSLSRLWQGVIFKPATNDTAEPGYVHSTYDDGTTVELTTTARTGIGRFTFPPSPHAKLLFYMATGQNHFEVSGSNELRGYIVRNSITMYFVARFSRAFGDTGSWDSIFTHYSRSSDDAINGAYVNFDTTSDPRVLMKIGMSWVSVANAAQNLDAENPGWDFEATQAAARAEWNRKLGLIQVDGGTPAQYRMFYTHLSQVFMHPNLASDVNGQYLGFDDQVHQVAPGHEHYANYSGWDIYRTWVPLVSVLLPREMSDMMQSLVDDGAQGGGLPIWPVENKETNVMSGGSSTPIVAGAYAFGARDFDAQKAFRIMDRDESDPAAQIQGYPERPYLADYLSLGYVPYDEGPHASQVAVSTTIEYATDELALSEFARALGRPDRADYYRALSGNWKNLFEPSAGYLVPRTRDGSFDPFFDPDVCYVVTPTGFDEGNAHTWFFAVHHDLRGLFDRIGGNEEAVRRLDQHFTKIVDGSTFGWPWIGPYAWMGNEPEFGAPWEYDWARAPWKTQALVRRILDEAFLTSYVGDEDLGAMSAWAIWASLGLYPEIAGVGGLAVTSPYFRSAVMHLGGGKTITIAQNRASPDSAYIQSATLDGRPFSKPWLSFDELTSGVAPTLNYAVGDAPNTAWGSAPDAAPPSFGN